jgi:hypothetical protein
MARRGEGGQLRCPATTKAAPWVGSCLATTKAASRVGSCLATTKAAPWVGSCAATGFVNWANCANWRGLTHAGALEIAPTGIARNLRRRWRATGAEAIRRGAHERRCGLGVELGGKLRKKGK